MLSDCLRAELAGQGIGVTAICPGFVSTGIAGQRDLCGRRRGDADARGAAARADRALTSGGTRRSASPRTSCAPSTATGRRRR